MPSTPPNPAQLIAAATAVSTPEDFTAFLELLDAAGATEERPVGDQYGNLTAISAQGDPEHFVFEPVTNGIDALLERHAARIRAAGGVVPDSPQALAATVDIPISELAEHVSLTLRAPGLEDRLTLVSRDHGIGIAADQARNTVLSLGQSPKNAKPYLAGAYGRGGSTMYREAKGSVIVCRPSPELIAETGCDDHVWVTAVYGVGEAGKKLQCWMYRVVDVFDRDRPAETGKVLALDPDGIDFDPGLQITHVAYRAPSLARHTRAKMDRRSLWVQGNTRLFDPVLPWSYVDDRPEARDPDTGEGELSRMYGRRRNFEDGTPAQLQDSPLEATVAVVDPDVADADPYRVPVTSYLFDQAQRRNATAEDHVVCFITNGQVQAHWTAADTRKRTADAQGTHSGLRRVADKVLFVAVDLDQIPPQRRAELIATDRTGLTDTALSRAVQDAVARSLVEQPELVELEKELTVSAARSSGRNSVTDKVAAEIARKINVAGTGQKKPTRAPRAPEVLLEEPTQLAGAETVTVVAGESKAVTHTLNAKSTFFSGATVTADIVGVPSATVIPDNDLTRGRFGVSVLMDDSVTEGEYKLEVSVEFVSAAGSLKTLTWTTRLRFVHTRPDPPKPKEGGKPLVMFIDNGDADSPGEVNDAFTGAEWANEHPDAAGHAAAVDSRIVAIIVNASFDPWVRYSRALTEKTDDAHVAQQKNRYIVGAAVALARVHLPGGKHTEGPDLTDVDDTTRDAMVDIAARAVIGSLPDLEDR